MNYCRKILFCLIALILPLSGCGAPAENNVAVVADLKPVIDVNQRPDYEMKNGGELRFRLPKIPGSFNIFRYTTEVNPLWTWYNPRLVDFSSDGSISNWNKSYITKVASNVINNKTSITYYLNANAFFNDGTPINCDTFIHTWQANIHHPKFSQIENVFKGENDKVVNVLYRGIYEGWPDSFQYILHPKALPKDYAGDTLKFAHPEWGAGPYLLKNINQAKGQVVFSPNPRWWGPKGKVNKITFKVLDNEKAVTAILDGKLDALTVPDIASFERLKQKSDLVELRTGSRDSTISVSLNSLSTLLSNIKLRKAVLKRLNAEEIGRRLSFDQIPQKNTTSGSLIRLPYQRGYSNNFNSAAGKNQSDANTAIDHLGWNKGGNGMRTKHGKVLKLNIVYANTQDCKIAADLVERQLSSWGLETTLRAIDFGQPLGSWDLLVTNQHLGPFTSTKACLLYCENGGLNYSSTGNPTLDKEIDSAELLYGAVLQVKTMNIVEAEAFKNAGVKPLTVGVYTMAVRPGLANYGPGGFFTTPVENIGWTK